MNPRQAQQQEKLRSCRMNLVNCRSLRNFTFALKHLNLALGLSEDDNIAGRCLWLQDFLGKRSSSIRQAASFPPVPVRDPFTVLSPQLDHQICPVQQTYSLL